MTAICGHILLKTYSFQIKFNPSLLVYYVNIAKNIVLYTHENGISAQNWTNIFTTKKQQ